MQIVIGKEARTMVRMAQLWRNEISTENGQTAEVVSTKAVVCCSKWLKYLAFFPLLGVMEVETMNDL